MKAKKTTAKKTIEEINKDTWLCLIEAQEIHKEKDPKIFKERDKKNKQKLHIVLEEYKEYCKERTKNKNNTTMKAKKTAAPSKKTAAPKKSKTAAQKAAATRGSKIMTKAKAIRKENPSKKWTDCVKAAGKSLKGKL